VFTLLRSHTLAAAAVAIGLVTAPIAALADTLTYQGYTVTNGKNVTITAPITLGVSAGRIVLDNVFINGVGVADINAWCIDLTNTLLGQGSFGLGNMTDPAIRNQLNALLTGAASLDLNAGMNSAAVQVAVWKTVVTNFTMNTTVTNGSAINTLANSFITNVNTAGNSTWKASNTMQIVSLDPVSPLANQRLITLVPGAPNNNNSTNIPEPASMAMIAVGLIGLGVARRLRRRTLH